MFPDISLKKIHDESRPQGSKQFQIWRRYLLYTLLKNSWSMKRQLAEPTLGVTTVGLFLKPMCMYLWSTSNIHSGSAD
jgi:hypothetical protein